MSCPQTVAGSGRRLLAVLLALGLLTTCATLKTYQITDLRFPNKSGKLTNGMRVVIQPDDSIPHVQLLSGAPTLVTGKEPKVPEDRRGPFARFSGQVKRYTASELLD